MIPRAHQIIVRPLTDADRKEISGWRYVGDPSIYDPGDGAFDLRAPEHVALALPDSVLVGYGTLGSEAQVPGGRYVGSPAVVDFGMGLRPDLVGMGHGADALIALMSEAERRCSATRYRVTVASANRRATALVTGLGFQSIHRFERASDGREFGQYELDAVPTP